MVYGVIDENNRAFYTYLQDVFSAIGPIQREYNWLVTDCDCNICNPVYEESYHRGYCWITGDELTEFAGTDKTQWLGAVFSGFEKDVPLEKILEHPLPVWEHPGFWQNPLTLQHPLAQVEIVPWDACCILLLSKDREITERFLRSCPQSQDLAAYNDQHGEGST